jgi:hypothetical protein
MRRDIDVFAHHWGFISNIRTGHLWLADQLQKKRPVMNHCLAQVFCAGLPLRMAKRDSVGCPVIFHNLWMVHWNICRTLFKVTCRIAARGHHTAQQLVGFRYRALWIVNEPPPDSAPGLRKAHTIARRERLEFETLDSFFAFFSLPSCEQ